MTTAPFRFDEIGYWSELKLEIVEKYGSAYTTAFRNSPNLKKYYIDAFSGAGVHVAKRTGKTIEGSPVRALNISPPFDAFYFIDMDADKTAYLKKFCENRANVHIYTGDANPYLTNELLPTIQFGHFNRALCLLDPYGLHLDWEVVRRAGESKAIDMFLNFPVMDMNRNAFWKNPETVPRDGIERMTRFWGDDSWRQVAYAEDPQQNLFTSPDLIKQDNEAIVNAFRTRLRKVGAFTFVPSPLPMRNRNNAVVYYLFFASQKPVAEKIIDDIFKKYRN
jgi:three-Cys-motif partner protein